MQHLVSSGVSISMAQLMRLRRGLIGCVTLVLLYLLVQHGLLNNALRHRREAFNTIIHNASLTTYPCQRKFWNTLYLLSGLGGMISPDVESARKGGSDVRHKTNRVVGKDSGIDDKRVNYVVTFDAKSKENNMNIKSLALVTPRKHGARTQDEVNVPSAPPGFSRVLKDHADPKTKEIVLSLVDATYSDFALNFYETSIVRFRIRNFLMVCLDVSTKLWLSRQNVSCYYFASGLFSVESGSSRGDFGTAGYYLKTNMKTLVMLHALRVGFTVLLVDLDIVFLKNPMGYLLCADCDVQIQQDRVHLNSGFVYVRPTDASRALYETAWIKYRTYRKSHDQAYINMAVSIFRNEKRRIKIDRLSPSLFPCGAFYFTTPTVWRMFANDPCEECVIVHNNYIGSTAAKRYRFKENQLWAVDYDGYYSDLDTKYIVYDNPYFFGDNTGLMERTALRSALAIGNITERVVLLPAFHCCDCQRKTCAKSRQQCSLLTVLKLRTFDEAFKGKYREHTFPKHPKVPAVFKTFISNAKLHKLHIQVAAHATLSDISETSDNLVNLIPRDAARGATSAEIREWLSPHRASPVVYFHSLYNAFDNFSDPRTSVDFQSRVDYGFQCTSYDQWEVKDKW